MTNIIMKTPVCLGDATTHGGVVKTAYRYIRSIYQPERTVTTEDIYSSTRTTRLETQDEMLERLDAYLAEPPNHSTLPQHEAFMRRVVAYDLPVGFCDSHERPALWTRLMKQADWTLGHDDYFGSGAPQSIIKPPHIDWDTVAEEQSRAETEQLRQQQWKGA